jgi:hypothetical protein
MKHPSTSFRIGVSGDLRSVVSTLTFAVGEGFSEQLRGAGERV